MSATNCARCIELLEHANERIAAIDGDERFHYPPATTDENALLALIQLKMDTEITAWREVRKMLGGARV